jgi:hypothetical protein
MITFITNNIAIGNSSDARNAKNRTFENTTDYFDSILNVAIDLDIEDGFKWRHKVGLLDGPGNHPYTFISAVILLAALSHDGRRVLIHCHEGKSRSVMVASTYLSIVEGVDFDDKLKQVMDLRGVDVKRPALYELSIATISTISSLINNH